MKKRLLCISLLLMVIMLSACSKKAEINNKNDQTENLDYTFLMVIDKVNSKLVKEKHDFKSESTKDQVREIISNLNNYKSNKYTSPLPNLAILDDWQIEEDTLVLNFKEEYNSYPRIEETLIRAALVNCFCQLKHINYVSFMVNGNPLMIDGRTIGRMKPDTFLMDMNLVNTTTNVTLYFPDTEKKILKKVVKAVPYNSTYTDEQLVIEALISGPEDSSLANPIPAGTKLLNIVTKDLVCYVNLSRDFLKYRDDVGDSFTIYSIVNSLCEMSGVRSVKITVDGESLEFYQSVPISDMLIYNYDILEEKTDD